MAGGPVMTPEQREDFLTLCDAGRATPDRINEYTHMGLIHVDRYGSVVLTGHGKNTYHQIKGE